jgi:hypothetical protein
MGISYNPRTVTDGLVLALDAGNYKNSRSSVSTNLVNNGSFANGAGSSNEEGSTSTNTIVQLENPGESPFVLRQNGNNTEYQLNIDSGMIANTTYVMSGWYAKSSDYNGGDTMFHARAFSSSGAHNATGTDTGTLIRSITIGSTTWEYRYQTIATPSDFSGAFDWYLGYGTNNTTGYRYYTNLKVENGTFPSLLNIVGDYNHGTPTNGPTYSSANVGSLVFDGTNDYVQTPITGTYTRISFDFWGFFDDPTLNTLSREESAFGDWNSNRVHFGTRWTGSNAGMHFNVNGTWQTTPTTNLRYGWNHYSLIYDTVSNQKLVYLNGILSSSNVTNGSMVLGDFRIGVATALNAYYRGYISNFKIYNRALSATEVSQNFNALRSRYGI